MRKQEVVTLKSGEHKLSDGTVATFNFGRDDGKIFRFTEMSAVDLELWNLEQKALLTSGPDIDKDVADIAENHSVTAAFFAYLAKDPKKFVQHIAHFNKLLYCYEVFDKAVGAYVKLTPDNIADHIEETASVTYLRNKAMEFTAFFLTGDSPKFPTTPDAQSAGR